MQIHHIEPWSKVREHAFENLIALCANCHARVTNGEIDRPSVHQYKRNLGLVHSRYGDMERRVIEHFAEHQDETELTFDRRVQWELMYLLRDGLLVEHHPVGQIFPRGGSVPWRYGLTEAGRSVVEQWRTGTPIS